GSRVQPASHEIEELDVQQEGHGDERIHPALPSSFVGSRAYRAEQVSDALALASRFQRPQGMVTVTTNPNWPEIRVVLRPGQNATVVPQITVRIFSARLKRFMAAFKRYFGSIFYVIKVVEFQKRGLPHAHIVFSVRFILPTVVLRRTT
ncbi:unnamed protein product, partial [Tilletia caries]